MIRVENVHKTYKDSPNAKPINVLADVSFQIKKGEFVSILGSSGCGKTTLINIIAGFISCSSGKVYFDGNEVDSPGRDRVVVFQEHNLFPWKTVLDNVEFGLKAKGILKKQRRVIAEEFIHMVHLSGFEDSYPYQLSGGMRQRVALARVLAVEPECILMDEPMGSLDLRIRQNLQLEILNLWQKTGKTILMVTHDIEEAVFLSQRVFVMNSMPGTIKEEVIVDIPYPRDVSVKMNDSFYNIKRHLWNSIMESNQGNGDE